MRYYIRHDKAAKVLGPYTVEALADAIQTGQISPDALASGDLGESIADLQKWRPCDWFPLARIAELRGAVPQLPDPPPGPPRMSRLTELVWLAGSVAVLASTTGRGLFLNVVLTLSAVALAVGLLRYGWAAAQKRRSA